MKIKNLAARCIVRLLNGAGYDLTALSGENITNVEHLQEFGLASKKPSGDDANGVVLCYGGDRGNSTLLVLEVPKYKPDLESGESALFNAFDSIVKLTNAGVIELNGSENGGMIKIETLVTWLNSHTHGTVPVDSAIVQADIENEKVVH